MRKAYITFSLLLLLSAKIFAQDEEGNNGLISVVSYIPSQAETNNLSSQNVLYIATDAMQRGTTSLCDFLAAKRPGVSLLSTGLGITKPVIRGSNGNRILVLINGLRFNYQQWQESYGIGLMNIGIEYVEITKGPMGVLNGSEAMGGVIKLTEESKPYDEKPHLDVGITMHSNTGGALIQAGYRKVKFNRWWKIRGGIESHSDYTDGSNQRIMNSRFNTYTVKATYGFSRNKWTSINNLIASYNQYGNLNRDIRTSINPDSRWSRRLNELPRQTILMNFFSSENFINTGGRSSLNINAGVQSNRLIENENGHGVNLDMHLLTLQYNARYAYELGGRNKLILTHLHSFENNVNFGARKTIPDARTQEASLSAFVESRFIRNVVLENGLGVGEKMIKTYFTPALYIPGSEVQPFNKTSFFYNAYSGFTFFPHQRFNIKANFSTGIRVANLAELSSNGVQQGLITYEIGNPQLKNEQVYSLNLFTHWQFRKMTFSLSPFYNYFSNYIYLSPTKEQWLGLPVLRYMQQSCRQIGAELSMVYQYSSHLTLQMQVSGMNSKTDDGFNTPFTPAVKSTPGLQYNTELRHLPIQFYSQVDVVMRQSQAAPNETPSKAYQLWNAGLNTQWKTGSHICFLSLSGHNLLNETYFDNLSRLKNVGLMNMGRNISLQFRFQL